VGEAGTGTFNQTGGANTDVNNLTLGNQAGSQGTYNFNTDMPKTGTLTVAGNEIVGNAGAGFFNHGPGMISVNGK